MPKMRHPDGGPTVEVQEDQVPTYESQGWVVQKAGKADSKSEKTREND